MGLVLLSLPVQAAVISPLSASIDPARAGEQLSLQQQTVKPSKMTPAIHNSAGKLLQQPIPGADHIKFVLKKIIITGNTVFSDQQLQQFLKLIYFMKLLYLSFRRICRKLLCSIVMPGMYCPVPFCPRKALKKAKSKSRLSRVIFRNINISSPETGKENFLLTQYGENLTHLRPLNMASLEYYALLANDMPGMEKVKTVLRPPDNPASPAGSSAAVFTPQFSKASGFIGIDNRGSKYLGQNDFSAGANINSVIQSGDQIGFQGLGSNRWPAMRYINLFTLQPLGSQGNTLALSGSVSRTRPEYLLAPLKLQGKSQELTASLQTPWIRSRAKSLYSTVALDYLNTQTNIDLFHVNLYDDHIRSFRAGLNYYQQDSYQGLNQLGVQLSHGLGIFGASQAGQANLSRINGDPEYTKVNLSLSRLQGLSDHWTFYISCMGQYTPQSLLSSEQFAFGGAQYGQAYDSAEITGDKGMAGKAELRYSALPNFHYLNRIQYFAFYDIGKVWNIAPIQVNGIIQQQSAASLGGGMRINFTPYLSGMTEIAAPLTRDVAAIGSRQARIFFSLTLSEKTNVSSDNNNTVNTLQSGASTNGPDTTSA